MNANLDKNYFLWRFYFVIGLILLVVLSLLARLVDLTVFKQSFLKTQGNVRTVRTVIAPAFRGMITDRSGYPLAVSTAVYSVWVDPQLISKKTNWRVLSSLLPMNVNDLYSRIQKAQQKHREFVFLKRELTPDVAAKIKMLKIPGVNLQEDFKRFYPAGEIAAQLIGFTNIDDQGQEGLELFYNSYLAGFSGKKIVLKDRIGREISNVKTLQNQQQGQDIHLSIDRRIQYLAYRELMAGVQENQAQSGTVVILNVKTGEVLAMVSQPSFNPNSRPLTGNKEVLRNHAITDIFEPGSTIKAFTVAAALQSGLYTPNTLIDTNPGWMRVDHHVIRDEHNGGVVTLTRALQLSSDIAMTKIILSLPSDTLYSLLKKMGFGDDTGVGFPGEEKGIIFKPKVWRPLSLSTLSFGYAISANALQLARAYAAIANHGVMVPVSLLKVDNPLQGKQVMNANIANQLLLMLETVVNTKTQKNALPATGIKARVLGYRVAGKTGTSKLLGANGYENRYTSSFIGIAPVSHPEIVVAVIIRDPRGKVYYGADVSAPIFSRIMEGTLRILDIPPDDLASLPHASDKQNA